MANPTCWGCGGKPVLVLGNCAIRCLICKDITQPSPSLAQTPRPVDAAGESTGREGLVAGERELAEARAGSLSSRRGSSGREASGGSSSS